MSTKHFYSHMNDLVLRNITEERTDKLQEQSLGQDGIASREGKNE